MTEIKEMTWIEQELTNLHNTATPTGEKLPSLKL